MLMEPRGIHLSSKRYRDTDDRAVWCHATLDPTGYSYIVTPRKQVLPTQRIPGEVCGVEL